MAYPFQPMNRKAMIRLIQAVHDSRYEGKTFDRELSSHERSIQDQNPPQSHLPYYPLENQHARN